MAATVAAPRYSVDDFETMSIRSAAPSYRSDAPSYHSADYRAEPLPAYAPRNAGRGSGSAPDSAEPSSSSSSSSEQSRAQRTATIGLPPLPPVAQGMGAVNIHNYRLPTWSTRNAPATRQYQNVIERRANAERERERAAKELAAARPRAGTVDRPGESSGAGASALRPLEDPYLVGERAAAQARRERLNRETGDDILIREDQQWDWLLAQMRAQEARDRDWSRFRRDADTGQRKTLFRRMGARMI